MSHTKYLTEAMVLHRFETGEADVTLLLLTADFGIIVVHAQSARKELAKMRAHIQTYNVFNATLVRGKYTWRLTGAEPSTHKVPALRGEALQACARMVTFLRRMTPSNDVIVEVFDIITEVRRSLPLLGSKEEMDNAELRAVAKLLASLGYLSHDILAKNLSVPALTQQVNTAIAESHL